MTVQQDLKGHKVFRVFQEMMALLALTARKDCRVFRGLPVMTAQQGHRVSKEYKEYQEITVRKALQVRMGHKASKGYRASKVCRDSRAIKVQRRLGAMLPEHCRIRLICKQH